MINQNFNILSFWKIKKRSILLQISIFSFIFLWGIKFDFYQLRYLIIIHLLLSVLQKQWRLIMEIRIG